MQHRVALLRIEHGALERSTSRATAASTCAPRRLIDDADRLAGVRLSVTGRVPASPSTQQPSMNRRERRAGSRVAADGIASA